jgi:hypothetical protein
MRRLVVECLNIIAWLALVTWMGVGLAMTFDLRFLMTDGARVSLFAIAMVAIVAKLVIAGGRRKDNDAAE